MANQLLTVMPALRSSVKDRILACYKPYLQLARDKDYDVKFLWPVTESVQFTAFEQLFTPTPDIVVESIEHGAAFDMLNRLRTTSNLEMQQTVEHNGGLFGYWNSAFIEQLRQNTDAKPFPLVPSATITEFVACLEKQHKLSGSIGIVYQVHELYQHSQELIDKMLGHILKIAPDKNVFVASNSEYVQAQLCNHFRQKDTHPTVIQKDFLNGHHEPRMAKDAVMQLLELYCVASCKWVINVLAAGTFLLTDQCEAQIKLAKQDFGI